MTSVEAHTILERLSGITGVIPESAKSDIRRLYRFFVGEPLKRCNCPDMYSDALILIKLRARTMSNSKYILKRGVVLHVGAQVYSRANITDAVAKKYLERYPDKVTLFESVPAEDADESPAVDAEKPAKKRKK